MQISRLNIAKDTAYWKELEKVRSRFRLAREISSNFKDVNKYIPKEHRDRPNPLTQIHNAYNIKYDTSEYVNNRTYFSKLYRSMRSSGIQHTNLVILLNNPYVNAIRCWNKISNVRQQIIGHEYPEIPEVAMEYSKWSSEGINEGIEDCSIDFAFFATGIKGIVNTATTAWKLFFSRKVTETAVRNAQKIEKVTNKLLEGEGKVGAYKELDKLNPKYSGLDKHHMPCQNYMKKYGVPKEEGICMNVAQSNKVVKNVPNRHAQTRTYKGKAKIESNLNPRDELAADIKDMKNIYKKDGLYNNEIREDLLEVIKQNIKKHPEIFKKGK